MNKMVQRIVFATVLAVCATIISSTVVNECKSGAPMPIKVDVSNCEQGPCELPKNTNVYINVTFDAPNDLETIEPKVIAHALGIDVNYPLSDSEGCNQLYDAQCPLELGQRVLYGTAIRILAIYPNIDFGIELTLYTYDEEGEKFPFACFQIDGKVVN